MLCAVDFILAVSVCNQVVVAVIGTFILIEQQNSASVGVWVQRQLDYNHPNSLARWPRQYLALES